jgi:hypothetical protein
MGLSFADEPIRNRPCGREYTPVSGAGKWNLPIGLSERSISGRAPYSAGSIPWDLMTLIAVGLLRKAMSAFPASTDFESALMPPVNVM